MRQTPAALTSFWISVLRKDWLIVCLVTTTGLNVPRAFAGIGQAGSDHGHMLDSNTDLWRADVTH